MAAGRKLCGPSLARELNGLSWSVWNWHSKLKWFLLIEAHFDSCNCTSVEQFLNFIPNSSTFEVEVRNVAMLSKCFLILFQAFICAFPSWLCSLIACLQPTSSKSASVPIFLWRIMPLCKQLSGTQFPTHTLSESEREARWLKPLHFQYQISQKFAKQQPQTLEMFPELN